MTIDRRLDRAYGALSGREAAIMALRRYKEGKPPDAAYSLRLQGREIKEYNRLVAIMNFVNGELADIVLVVREQVHHQELRLALLKEIIDHAAFVAAVRNHLDECSTGRTASRKRGDTDGLIKLLEQEGGEIALPLPNEEVRPSADADYPPAIAARVLATAIRTGLESCWTQLRSVAIVASEYAEEFGGEDAFKPDLREFLDDALLRTEVSSDQFTSYVDNWALPNEHEEALAMVRKLADVVLA